MAARPKVLVVECEYVIALDLMLMLQLAGAEAIGPAASLSQAAAIARTERVHAALLEVRLGKERAYTLAGALRARKLPFAFVTATSCDDIDPDFADVPCITKPVSPVAIKNWVAALPPQPDTTAARRFRRPTAPA